MKLSLNVLAFVLCTALTNTVEAVDTQFLQGLGNTQYEHLNSKFLERSFHIYVSLPDGYQQSTDEQYPTIYLLDGGLYFPLLSSYHRLLTFGEQLPQAIIVGISYGSNNFEEGNLRSTDFTAPSEERSYWGGAGKFQQFLKRELLPHIEETYRSLPDKRVIFGQSLGGQFVLYTALTQPDLFWGHIASNPALHRNLAFFLELPALDSQSPTSKLFVGSGSEDDPRFKEPASKWIAHWSQVKNLPWELRAEVLEGQSHLSAAPVSFRQGVRRLFNIQ